MPKKTDGSALPKINLKDLSISQAALSFIPLSTVEKYQVAAFAEDEKTLKIAIVYPEALKKGFYESLKDLEVKIGKEIVLYQTDPASMKVAVNQYKKETVEPAKKIEIKDEKPPLFELGKTVSSNYLRKVPLSYTVLHRLVCVDFLPPATYWFATDNKKTEEVHKTLSYIEENNKIQAKVLTVSTAELDDLIEYYKQVEAAPANNKQWEEFTEKDKYIKKENIVPTVVIPVKNEPILGKDVVVPQAQGAILSSEEERQGIAGVFQKMAQNLSSDKTPTINPTTPPATPVEITPIADKPAEIVDSPAPIKTDRSEKDPDIGKAIDKPIETIEELKGNLRSGYIPQIVAAIISYAIHEKASDIHLEAFDDEVRVRYRVDGQLIDIVKLPPDVHSAIVSRIKILARLKLDETRVPQDGRFDVNFENAQVDLRVSVMPTVHGEKVVMRILDKSKGISSLEALGIEGLAYESLTKAINKPYGICLATGPTGSGKSTSLYAILNRIATPNVNVVTLEDPVEYEVKGINQSQIRPKIGFTFAEGLRSILRQDPNIIMVGEIRDGETATMATQAALTGHLVLSSLHTNDASGAIPRMTNMGIEPFLITSSLNIAMAQRLVRKICPHCKSKVNLPQGILDSITKEIENIKTINPLDAKRVKEPFIFYQGTGCDQCGGKGYLGRMGIYEVLLMSDAIEELTLARASAAAIQEQAQKEGMITMYQDGLLKVISGVTTLDEILRETSNK